MDNIKKSKKGVHIVRGNESDLRIDRGKLMRVPRVTKKLRKAVEDIYREKECAVNVNGNRTLRRNGGREEKSNDVGVCRRFGTTGQIGGRNEKNDEEVPRLR